MEKTIETKIIEIDKFPNTTSVHEEVYIYRRLEDLYDPTAIAILNAKKEVVGYLDRNIAATQILPKIKKGVKFRCFITGPPDEEGIPIDITEVEDIELASHKESLYPVSTTSYIKFTEEEVDDEIGELEDEEELEYPDLDKLRIDTDENGDDWN